MQKKILIVDDEPDMILLLKELAKKKYNIDCKYDLTGAKCIEMSQGYKPDLILLDMNLPKISGLGLLKELKRCNELSHIPVVVFSGVHQSDVVKEALELGASTYFTKNGSIDDLFDVVEAYIN